MKHLIPLSFLFLLFAISSCTHSSTGIEEPPPPPGGVSYQVEDAFPNLSFNNPLDLQHPGDGSGRLFVVERNGTIQVFQNDPSATQSTTFLDIQSRVDTQGEGGLLGLAFHPNFESNGLFYVNYTAGNPFRTIVSEFQVSAVNPDQANVTSEREIISFNQPFANHNGGQIQFGPDGFLYIATGDGGSGGDPQGNAQNRSNLLGALLRIDVDGSSNGNYAIPSDNPYVGNNQGFREEIFAHGLRNPYRFSFDAANGDLWVGDVGQNRFEEIDLVENGDNLGWNMVEGNACFEPMEGCDMTGLTAPIFVYEQSGSQSVTGGFVYRGSDLGLLTGQYIFADFISGRIWSLDISDLNNPANALLVDTDLSIAGFGEDANNELYICSFDGNIYQLVEQTP